MVNIRTVNKEQIATIRELAQEFWPVAFDAILSAEQIEYMMEMMYNPASLEKQMNKGHQFAIASRKDKQVGYLSYETNCDNSNKTKIHKLYISPNHQRLGVGEAMVNFVALQALKANNSTLFLNVNKHNKKAISFYNKLHFQLVKEEKIDIGDGFIMDDYVFELTLNQL
ncbi:MAG: GNAT family N-acetyltransferase [Bacteroidales bacterium]|nr:GNAT family N-acetyltransferase [Bacteroidales bacterium]